MPEFKKAKIEDKKEADRLLAYSGCPSLEYNFTTIFIWQDTYKAEFAMEKDALYIRTGEQNKSYLIPCAKDLKGAVDTLLKEEQGIKFHSVNEEQKAFLEENYPGRFEFAEKRDMADYIYTAESLRELTGKKLRSKRNHINRFVADNPEWSFERITPENIAEVQAMHKRWCELADIAERPGLLEETIAVKRAFEYYDELELSGGLIRAEDEIVAFSIGDKLNDNTFLVHIEKAFNSVNGAYPIINREFVKRIAKGFEFIDREDDAGDEGLRKAKLSYRPHRLVTKYTAKEILK